MNQILQQSRNMLTLKLVELVQNTRAQAPPLDVREICAPGPCFLSQDLRVHLDDSTHRNSELKEQVALAE